MHKYLCSINTEHLRTCHCLGCLPSPVSVRQGAAHNERYKHHKARPAPANTHREKRLYFFSSFLSTFSSLFSSLCVHPTHAVPSVARFLNAHYIRNGMQYNHAAYTKQIQSAYPIHTTFLHLRSLQKKILQT